MEIYHPLLRGAIEMHCHNAPSVFPRRQTDWEFVSDLKTANMGGAVLKAHESSTVERAELIRLQEPELHVYGGLVCNNFTGGLAPEVVDVAIRLGAKCIWMPTIASAQHLDHFAGRKTKLFGGGNSLPLPERGLRIWDEKQDILPEVHDILDLIAAADIVLATGHISPPEVIALTKAAFEHGVRKVLVQHAEVDIAPVPEDMQKELASMGAFIEKCYLACSSDFNFPIEKMAASIRTIGADHCVMVTDYGQAHNMPVVEALSNFVADMLKCGVSEEDISQMIVQNPRTLLNIANYS